jgi:ABC-type branched-subunit amino acid transport system permease subunit
MNIRRLLPGLISCCVLAVAAPFLSSYGVGTLTQVVVYSCALVGLDLIVSRVNMMSFGHAGFMAVGAYTSVVLLQNEVPFLLAALVGAALAGLVGAVLAVPASRLTGFSFALVTFAFTSVVAGLTGGSLLLDLTGGESGLAVPPALLFGIDLLEPLALFYVSLVLLAITMVLVTTLVFSRTGRALRTVRESEAVAAALGIRAPLLKVGTFAFSASIAGIAGVLLAQTLGSISGHTFGLDQSIMLVAMLTVGGMGRALGPLVGAAVFILLPETLHGAQENSAILFAVVFIVALIVAPTGVVGLVSKWAGMLGRIIHRRRDARSRPHEVAGTKTAATEKELAG